MKKRILLTIFALTTTVVVAQDNMTQSAINLPQSIHLNPAMRPDHSFLSIPFFGSFQVGFSNSFSYNDVIVQRDGVKYLDTKQLLSVTGRGSGMATAVNWDLINTGFYVSDEDFLGITLRSRAHATMNWPGDLFGLMLDNPLESYNNYNIDYNPNVLGWVEAGVSYSRPVSDNFTLGLRVKYVGGLVSMQTENGIKFNVDKHYDKYTLMGDYNLMMGNINIGDGGNDIVGGLMKNPGFAVDLGVNFVSNDRKITASASVSDLGMIWWNAKNSSRLQVKNPNQKFDYEGFGDLNLDGTVINFNHAVDSIFEDFNRVVGVDTLSGVGFTTVMPMTFQAMGSYSIGDYFRHNVSLGIVGSLPYRGEVNYAISAGYAYRTLNGMWQLMANYTYSNFNPVGVGLGVVFTAGCFEMYLATDNILPAFSVGDARGTSARLAFNFFLDRNTRRR